METFIIKKKLNPREKIPTVLYRIAITDQCTCIGTQPLVSGNILA
jgi:hypothetical protein